jgi:4-hydroxy-4-methyl-2-oxoglutarate aldolase
MSSTPDEKLRRAAQQDTATVSDVLDRLGIAEAVIDGINCDVSLCLELKYPIYSRRSWIRTRKDWVQVEGTNFPLDIGDARVRPGDLQRGDADGVLVTPREHENKVLETAEEITAGEEHIRQATRKGMRLDEARRRFRNHQLQARSK